MTPEQLRHTLEEAAFIECRKVMKSPPNENINDQIYDSFMAGAKRGINIVLALIDQPEEMRSLLQALK